MKNIKNLIVAFAIICGIFMGTTTQAQDLYVPVTEVYDGDTIKIRLTLPSPLDVVSVRIYGIDTPEMPAKSYATTGKLSRADCVKEAEQALLAKWFVEELVNRGGRQLILRDYSWDKYGGRIDAIVYAIDPNTGAEIDIARELIEVGMAVEYYGGAKTKNWCE